MTDRVNINEVQPGAFKAMFAVERYLSSAELSTTLKELIKVRASQINGCAYCIAMHTESALKNGESQERLFERATWRESNLFSGQERAVLELTDEITRISEHGLSQETYTAASQALGNNVLAEAIVQVAAINSWNRIAVATQMEYRP